MAKPDYSSLCWGFRVEDTNNLDGNCLWGSDTVRRERVYLDVG